MKKVETPLKDLYVIELERFGDDRGFFLESYNKEKFSTLGFEYDFVQDNHSKSVKNVVRGLHFQSSPGQAKLIRCIKGKVWDVVVDIRPNSLTFKQWFGIELTDNNNKMLMIPIGFAHGFAVLSSIAEVQYKCSSVYNSKTECGFKFNDPEIGVDWRVKEPIISQRDANAPLFKDLNNLDITEEVLTCEVNDRSNMPKKKIDIYLQNEEYRSDNEIVYRFVCIEYGLVVGRWVKLRQFEEISKPTELTLKKYMKNFIKERGYNSFEIRSFSKDSYLQPKQDVGHNLPKRIK